MTCTGTGAGVGVGATMEEALPEVEGDEAALAELEGDGVAATVGDGVGGTGSARYHSWKCPVWPCGAK